MKCSIEGCPGEYEERPVVHTVIHQKKVVVINNVPADVCPECGDTVLKPDTVRHVEELLQKTGRPSGSVPLYEYA